VSDKYLLKLPDTVIHSIEFEMGQILDLRIEISDGHPMFFICWNGTRLENNREYHIMMSKFVSIRKVLYHVYKWGYCDECRTMTPRVHHYTYTYKEGHNGQPTNLCLMHTGALEELEERGDIINLKSCALEDVE